MAVLRIRDAIECGELAAGQQVTELGLARKLGVGQPTVREALLELEFIGYVERVAPRKTRVTLLSPKQIDDIYVVRSRLETLAAELLAKQRAPDLRECEERYREMKEHARAADNIRFFRADLEFHRALWRATGNDSLVNCLSRLVPKLFAFGIIHHADANAEKLSEIAELHGQLMGVIRKGDSARAREFMTRSMESAWRDDLALARS